MTNNFLTRFAAIIAALCLTIGGFSSVPAYAMENEEYYTATSMTECLEPESGGNYITPYSGHDIFPYATVYAVGGFTFTSTNLTPTKTVQDDARMHRLIYKIQYKQADNLASTTRFRFTVIRANGDRYAGDWHTINNGSTYLLTNNPDETGDPNSAVPVYHGETVQFYFETDSGRSITVDNYWIYCD